ncbi:MAG: hypothetical protein P8J50_09875 [Acidimicrobiales bacterium]|jgi:CRP-like cAMP-binding protein|nr:hypothetical protein [Acidimicrobiales bacterium]
MGVIGEVIDERLSVEGEHHGRLLLVTSGSVSVQRVGKELRQCGVGDFVGEMSLLSDERRCDRRWAGHVSGMDP